jgi:hypothetical protein
MQGKGKKIAGKKQEGSREKAEGGKEKTGDFKIVNIDREFSYISLSSPAFSLPFLYSPAFSLSFLYSPAVSLSFLHSPAFSFIFLYLHLLKKENRDRDTVFSKITGSGRKLS